MDGKDRPNNGNGHPATMKAVCRSHPIIIIQKQTSKLVASIGGSRPSIRRDGTTNQAGVERGPSEPSEGNRPSFSSGNNNHGAGGQVDPIPKKDSGKMVCDPGRNHETINLVATDGKSSQETTRSGHESQSNANENRRTVTMRNRNYVTPVCTGNPGTGRNTETALDSNGNGVPAYFGKLASRGHEGTAHTTNIPPTFNPLTVAKPVLHHYSLEYRWSPMLKYCKPEEVHRGHISLGETLH